MNTLTLSLLIALLVPVAPGALVDSESPVPAYTGAWLTDDTITYAIGGSARYTNDTDATIEFDVTTDGFTLFFLYAAGGGSVDVCVDGADCVTVDTDGTASSGRADFSGLASGTKTITVDVTSVPFYFDALYIYPELALESVAQSTVNIGGTDYTTQYHYSFTAGEVITVTLLAMLITVQVANLVMWLWHRQ
jgi:hypothetical protein